MEDKHENCDKNWDKNVDDEETASHIRACYIKGHYMRAR